MIRVFLDASVLVAACASKTGASALILGYSRKKKLQGYVSLDVIGEARKNISLKLGRVELKRLAYFLQKANLKLIPHARVEEIALCEQVINEKDAPILAAFRGSPAPYLVTLDKRHFLKPDVIKFARPKQILLPGEFVSKQLRPSGETTK